MRRRKWRVLAQDHRGSQSAVVDLSVHGTDFDELVIDGFLHLEKMSADEWCLIVTNPHGTQINITIREPSKTKRAAVFVVEGDVRGAR